MNTASNGMQNYCSKHHGYLKLICKKKKEKKSIKNAYLSGTFEKHISQNRCPHGSCRGSLNAKKHIGHSYLGCNGSINSSG